MHSPNNRTSFKYRHGLGQDIGHGLGFAGRVRPSLHPTEHLGRVLVQDGRADRPIDGRPSTQHRANRVRREIWGTTMNKLFIHG